MLDLLPLESSFLFFVVFFANVGSVAWKFGNGAPNWGTDGATRLCRIDGAGLLNA